MDTGDQPAQTIGQLGHHIGLHVSVNLQGKTLDGVFHPDEEWVSGVVVGMSELGDYVTVELDRPVGGGERKGLLHRRDRGTGRVSIDDPAQVRVLTLTDAHPDGVPPEIIELARAGKTVQAIRAYRELNGATLDEARAFFARLDLPSG